MAASLTLLALIIAGSATAKDSHAPKGAGDAWLPCEPWVMYHWLPFEARSLYAELGVRRKQWQDYIRADDDKHSLAKFIRRQGKDPKKVVRKLMRPWKGRVSRSQLKELNRRADELLTQGHLAQHVFFHYYHHPMLAIEAEHIFNVSPETYHAARMAGFKPREIAEHGGVSLRGAVRRADAVLKKSQLEGVKGGHVSLKQSRVFRMEQRERTHNWLRQSIRPRKKKFPHVHKPVTGTRDQQACFHMVGPVHPRGRHEKIWD